MGKKVDALNTKEAILRLVADGPRLREVYAVSRVLGSKPPDAALAGLLAVPPPAEHLPMGDPRDVGNMGKRTKLMSMADDLVPFLEEWFQGGVDANKVHAVAARRRRLSGGGTLSH